MISNEKSMWLARFSSAYMKRWISQGSERLMEGKAFRPVRNLNRGTRYGLEAGLYALMAYAEPKLPERTYLQSVFRQLAIYATPEIGRRLVRDYRETLRSDPAPNDPSEAAVREILLEMDDPELTDVLRWFSETTPEERKDLDRSLIVLTEETGDHVSFTPEAHTQNRFARFFKSLGEKFRKRSRSTPIPNRRTEYGSDLSTFNKDESEAVTFVPEASAKKRLARMRESMARRLSERVETVDVVTSKLDRARKYLEEKRRGGNHGRKT